MSETILTKYVIQDRTTKLFYRGSENDCSGKTVAEAVLYDTFNDADEFANVEEDQREAIFQVTVTFTVGEEVGS